MFISNSSPQTSDYLNLPEFAPLRDYISFSESDEQVDSGFLSKKEVAANLPYYTNMVNQWICYPDLFIDAIVPHNSHFHLFFFQRLMLRCMARGVHTYEVFSRGTSKTFLAYLDRYLHCMFIPRHKTSVVAGTNKQAAQIVKEKFKDDI